LSSVGEYGSFASSLRLLPQCFSSITLVDTAETDKKVGRQLSSLRTAAVSVHEEFFSETTCTPPADR